MCSRWNELQQEAREAENGLWGEEEPIKPWVTIHGIPKSDSNHHRGPTEWLRSL